MNTLHFNAMLKTSIKDKLVLRFSSACFQPHFCHVIVTSFRMINKTNQPLMIYNLVRKKSNTASANGGAGIV
jgi:hypothetical protein